MTVGTDFALARKERARLGWCALLVACAHMTLLVPSPAAVARPAAAATSATLHVRLLRDAASPSPAAPASPDGAGALPDARGHGAPNNAVASSKKVAPQSDSAAAVPQSADVDYLPRSALTVAPRPLAAVLVDYPYFDGEAEQYIGEFDLFIDDAGGVVRVANATPALPGILANAVRETFLAARFAPGEIDGRRVRSRMRIEVTFDSRRLPPS
jgi:protein TonB